MLAHESLISCLLEVVNLPKKLGIIYIKGHQAGCLEEVTGNRLANEEARKTALLPKISTILLLLLVTAPLPEKLYFPPELLEIIKKSGAEERGDNWFPRDGKQWMLWPYKKKMYVAFYVGLFTPAKRAIEGCLICAKTSIRVTKKLARGGRPYAPSRDARWILLGSLWINFPNTPKAKLTSFGMKINTKCASEKDIYNIMIQGGHANP